MYERLLIEAEVFLQRQKDSLASIRKVWTAMNELAKKGQLTVPPLVDFSCLLDADNRFELLGGENEEAPLPDEDETEHEEFEKLGFAEDQFVRLRAPSKRPEDDADEEEDVAVTDEEEDALLDRELLPAQKKPAANGTRKSGRAIKAAASVKETAKKISRTGRKTAGGKSPRAPKRKP